jgi:hypothetical protein
VNFRRSELPSNALVRVGLSAILRIQLGMSFLSAPSVTFAVTTGAKRNQVVHHIVTTLAPGFHVMDLQAFHGTALLTPPTISLQDLDSEFRVLFRAQFKPRSPLT